MLTKDTRSITGTGNKFSIYYVVREGKTPHKIVARPTKQQRPHGLPPATVYRTADGETVTARYVKTWDELTEEQRRACKATL